MRGEWLRRNDEWLWESKMAMNGREVCVGIVDVRCVSRTREEGVAEE